MSKRVPLALAVVLVIVGLRSGAPQDSENPYRWSRPVRGTIHSHSIYSNDLTFQMRGMVKDLDHRFSEDVEAMIKRAERLGLNFLLLQDHGEKLALGHWYHEGELERNSDRVNFAGGPSYGLLWVVRGFEWTQGSLVDSKPVPHKAREGEINHVGVFRTEDFTGTSLRPETGMPVSSNLAALYRWLLMHDPNKVFCSFNHPSYGSSQFNDFAIPAGMEHIVDYFRMIEVGSGSSIFYEGPDKLERHYQKALQRGWRLMPAIGADNPGKLTYQNARKRHTAVWVDNVRGQHPFFDHVRECCGFASEDEDAVAELWFTGVHDAMGFDRRNPVMGQRDWLYCDVYPPTLNYRVYDQGKAEGWRQIKIVRVRQNQIDESTVGRIEGRLVIEPSFDDICFYLKAQQLDGDMLLTAPIWVTNRQLLVSGAVTHPWLGVLRWELHGIRQGERNGHPVMPPIQPELRLRASQLAIPEDWQLRIDWVKPTPNRDISAAYYQTVRPTVIDRANLTLFPPTEFATSPFKDRCGGQFPDPASSANLDEGDTRYHINLYWYSSSSGAESAPVLTIPFYIRPLNFR
ncbi:MAG: hypothetical protein WAP74_03510 [Patescibacteria group bacterium]